MLPTRDLSGGSVTVRDSLLARAARCRQPARGTHDVDFVAGPCRQEQVNPRRTAQNRTCRTEPARDARHRISCACHGDMAGAVPPSVPVGTSPTGTTVSGIGKVLRPRLPAADAVIGEPPIQERISGTPPAPARVRLADGSMALTDLGRSAGSRWESAPDSRTRERRASSQPSEHPDRQVSNFARLHLDPSAPAPMPAACVRGVGRQCVAYRQPIAAVPCSLPTSP